MTPELLAALAAGATVVTPTRRLALAVRRTYDSAQEAAGRRAWPSPDVLPWSAWQQRQWQGAQFATPLPLLLDAEQELALWERVIHESPEATRLLQVDAAAAEAREAWRIVCSYRLLPALRRGPRTEEADAFLGWTEAFTHFCGRQRLVESARLPDELAVQVSQRTCPVPAHLVMFGFDAVDPQRSALIQVLRAAGARVDEWRPEPVPREARLAAYPGAEQEIHAAASWARNILSRTRHARIGVVVPDLATLRAPVARIFDDVLLPEAVLTPGRVRQRPWNLSLGRPLAEWPVIHAALVILDLAQGRLPAPSVGTLLRSPFLGDAETERMPRALLDARLCELREPHVDLDTLEREAAWESRLHAAPLLLDALRRLRRRAREALHEVQLPSGWGPRLQSLLAAAGWPGQRTLDSEEFQTVEAWRDLMAGLARFDLVVGPIAYPNALHLVRRLAVGRLFQPETPDVPVQILGVLESSGLQFDHLTVLGLHGEAWPRPSRPNPLLPAELQRRAGVPGGSADWELEFARRMMAGWRGAAREVVFSYPVAEGDRVLRASPLLAGIARRAVDAESTAPPDYRHAVHASRRLELLEDVEVAQLPAGVRSGGGASLLRDQAACSFRAFAAHRLGADSVQHPLEGLSAGERGSLVHAALAGFWGEVRDSRGLTVLQGVELEAQVQKAVDLALAPFARRRRSLFQTRFVELERERLTRLVLEWLQVDAKRPPFEVLPPEQAQEVEIGGVRLQMRLDRIDRVSVGRELLIDYKTGAAAPRSWFGDRPDDPQLPAYTLARTTRPAGLAFGIVKRGGCRMQGLGERGGLGEGIDAFDQAKFEDQAPDWARQLEAWSQRLTTLGAQFRSGEVRVNPKRYPQTCRHCGFASLCRVTELLDLNAQDEPDDE